MSSSTLSKIYTAVMVMLPAVNVYKSFIPSIELGTLIILLCTIVFLSQPRQHPVGFDKVWVFVLVIFLLGTIVSTFYNPDYTIRFFFRYLKIALIVISIVYCGKDFFNYSFGLSVLKKFSIACAIFITIQTAFNLFGVHIPGFINFLVSIGEGESADPTMITMFRPTAFFFEPAHYACYNFVFLSYLLTHEDVNKRMQLILLTLFGIFLSTSGTGYIIAPILLVYAFIIGRGTKSNKKIFKYTVMSMAVFVVLALTTSIGQGTLARFIDESGEIGGAATGRLDSGADLLFYRLPSELQWIGCGFGFRPEDVYFPSLYAILYGDGYIGLGALLLLGIAYYRKTSNFGKLLLLAYTLLFTGAGVFNFGAVGLYFIFISLETALKSNPQLQNRYLT